jgi:hypothetical protein
MDFSRYFGLADGFAPAVSLRFGDDPAYALVAADFDDDGSLELVVSNRTSNDLSLPYDRNLTTSPVSPK